MAIYSHILLATDFSRDSGNVMAKGVELSRLHNARLSLLHVVEYSGAMYSGELPLADNLDIEERMVHEAEQKLQEFIRQNQLEDTGHFVEVGIPKHEIVRVAQEQQADLIVLGSHGRHGLQLLLGSTANGTLHLATCDVLAVRIAN
jgi:universal stress protein A